MSSGLGNSCSKPPRQVSPSNGWFFTFNNYNSSNKEFFIEEMKKMTNKYWYVLGDEVGEEGTPHLQGYIALKDPKKKFRMTKFLNNSKNSEGIICMRTFRAKGDRWQCMGYCSKEKLLLTNIKEKRELKFDWEFNEWQCEILSIINMPPHERFIFWYWGAQGIGKTQFLKRLQYENPTDILILEGTASNMKNGIAEFVLEHGETPETIFMNIPLEQDMTTLSYKGLETIKDMFFYSGKYKGMAVNGPNPHLIIMANNPPITENKKFIVKEIN